MGQTVRNHGPYDRLWVPGTSRDRAVRSEGPKIEYLEDRRKARAAQRAEHQDALQYDSNFRKAAAVHGERPGRQHFLRESASLVRSRPQGVGGRQQMPDPVRARGRQAAADRTKQKTAGQARVPQGQVRQGQARASQQGHARRDQARPPQSQARQGQARSPQGQVRQGQARPPQGQARQGQVRPPQGQVRQGQARPPQGQARQGQVRPPQGQVRQGQVQPPQGQARQGQPRPPQGQARQGQPRSSKRPGQASQAEPVRQPAKGIREQKRGFSGQAASMTVPRQKTAGRVAAPYHEDRPQRDTVTDFHSVAPSAGPSAQAAKPRGAGSKPKTGPGKKQTKTNAGHGRKLTPKYKTGTKDRPRSKLNGAPLMKDGVVGFDMGAYGRDTAGQGPYTRPFKTSSVITTIMTIAICFMLLTAVLAGQARVSNYSHHNANLENSIQEMEERISKLKMQIALEEDLGNIQERAEALGLGNPEDTQVEYVDLDATDEVKAVPSLVLSQSGSPVPDDLFGALMAWFDTMAAGSQRTELSSAETAAAD